jgi:hypothetical protein
MKAWEFVVQTRKVYGKYEWQLTDLVMNLQAEKEKMVRIQYWRS